jgi:hypothetical protein
MRVEAPKSTPDWVVATHPRLWLSPRTNQKGVPSPVTETLMPVRFWLSTFTDGEWAAGAGLAGISPVEVRGRGAPPAADAIVRESTFNPAVVAGLVVRMCVPALNLMPWAELPQPVIDRPPLDSAAAVVPLI